MALPGRGAAEALCDVSWRNKGRDAHVPAQSFGGNAACGLAHPPAKVRGLEEGNGRIRKGPLPSGVVQRKRALGFECLETSNSRGENRQAGGCVQSG